MIQLEEMQSEMAETKKSAPEQVPVQVQTDTAPHITEVVEHKVVEDVVPKAKIKKEPARKKARIAKAEQVVDVEQPEVSQVKSRHSKPVLSIKKK